ncbi:hypothetical protein ACFE04_002187 [Oxalis oulophora]
MAQRKLNLNAPLLSVRRFPSKLVSAERDNDKTAQKRLPNGRYSLPLHNKPDFSSDQVTEPVAVPFQWEQVPGQAKDCSQYPQEDSLAAKCPQTRVFDEIKQQQSSLKHSGELYGSRLLAEVPSINGDSEFNESGRWDPENDDEDVFSDALEALSPTDSFSFNCSVTTTGLNGSNIAPSGTFFSDPGVRDFMMSRFLPAARAMAVESPKYASKKQQQVENETPRQQIKKVITETKMTNVSSYELVITQRQRQDEEKADHTDASEDEYEYYEAASSNISNKVRGFFPRLCFRNSLCLLNSVPGIKVKSQSDKQKKGASVGSHWKSVKKLASDVVCKQNSETKPRDFFPKSDQQTASRSSSPFRRSVSGFVSPGRNNTPRFNPGARSCELSKPERNLHGGSSDRFACSNEQKTANIISSPFRRSSVNGFVSPLRNVPRLLPQYTGTRSCELPRIDDMLQNGVNKLLYSNDLILNNQRSGSAFISPHRNNSRSNEKPKTENTVNSGSERHVYTNDQKTNRSSSPLKRSGNSFVSPIRNVPQSPFRGKDFQGIPKEAQKFTASMLSLNNKRSYKSQELQSTKSMIPAVEKTLYVDSVNIYASSLSDKDHLKGQAKNKVEGRPQLDQQFDDELIALALVKIKVDRKKLNQSSTLDDGLDQSPIAPPLPKTPSESWLGRTLPSLPSRNSSRASSPFRSRELLKTSSGDTKWETIVKSSYLHNDHGRYSEELIRHISQQFDS